MYNPTPPAPPKKGLPKGLKIALVVVLVLGVGFVGLLVLGVGGYVYFTRSAREAATSGGAPASRAGLTGSSSAPTSPPAAEVVAGPEPTEAQRAAVAGGQSAEWPQQELAWTVPQRWSRQTVSSTSFLWRSPGSFDAASLIGTISPMPADFPVAAGLNAAYQQASQRKQLGQVSEVRWLKLGGIKGVMFREAAPEDPDGPQRLQWIAYRDYKGQQQMLNIMLASRGKDFARHEDALYGILYSMELGE